MPPQTTQHPDDFDLLDYAGGKLRTRDRGPVEAHLADCTRCVTRLDALMRRAEPDPLLSRLRAARAATAVADPTPLPGSLTPSPWPEVVRQLAAVSHPNLLMPEVGGRGEPAPAGIDFHALACAENRPAVAVVCDYFRQAALGLAAAHAGGVPHGDLHLADFVLFDQATVRVTGFERSRVWAESPPAPATADLAAFGRCFAALLSGRTYRTGLSSSPEAGLERSLPADVYRILARFSPDNAKRFATMDAVAEALTALADGVRPTWWRRLFPAKG